MIPSGYGFVIGHRDAASGIGGQLDRAARAEAELAMARQVRRRHMRYDDVPGLRADQRAAGAVPRLAARLGQAQLLAMLLLEKFGQLQPLNRQAERYVREDVTPSLSTLADQIGGASAVLEQSNVARSSPIPASLVNTATFDRSGKGDLGSRSVSRHSDSRAFSDLARGGGVQTRE